MATSVLPPCRTQRRISAASPTVGARRFQGTAWAAARYGEGSTKGGRPLLISFRVSFHLPFPSPSSPGQEREGGERRDCNQGKGKPSQEPVFRATSASSRPLNARSHFGAQPIAEGDTPMPKNPPPAPCPKTQSKKRSKSWEGVSGAGGVGRPRCRCKPSQLLAITRRRGQSRHRSQIISCFNAGRVFWTAFFQLSPGKNVSPYAYRHCRCCRQSKARVDVLGKQTPRLANKECFV